MRTRQVSPPAPPPFLRLWLEGLEDRIVPTVTVDLLGQPGAKWIFEGPAGIDSGLTFTGPTLNGVTNNGDRINGAINNVAISAQDPGLAFAASVNGGIFK